MCPVEFLRGETCDGYTYTAYTEHSGQVSLCGTLPLRRIHQEAERVMCIREEVELLEDGSSVRVMNVNYAGYHQDGITHYVQWQIEDPAAEKGWLYIERKKVSNLPVVTIPFPTYEAALSYLFGVLGWDRPFEIEQASKPQLATVSDWSQYSDAGMFS